MSGEAFCLSICQYFICIADYMDSSALGQQLYFLRYIWALSAFIIALSKVVDPGLIWGRGAFSSYLFVWINPQATEQTEIRHFSHVFYQLLGKI